MLCILALLSLVCYAHSLTEPQYQREFTNFLQEYSKQYAVKEIFDRYNIFKANLDRINEENSKNNSWTVGLNIWSDMTREERRAYRGAIPRPTDFDNLYTVDENYALYKQTSKDHKNHVTDVKSQGSCGSCWAFAATAVVEASWSIQKGRKYVMSDQQLLDCDSKSYGCNGGYDKTALEYVVNKGQCRDGDYPYLYQGRQRSCKSCSTTATFSRVKTASGESNMLSLLDKCPITAWVNAGDQFSDYNGGVLTRCNQDEDDGHLVAITGYGTTSDGIKYWKIKNSWGTRWGENGYIKMQRGKDLCWIEWRGVSVCA